jgi:TRAP-type uncharacterized transport system fused permease subunit
MVTPPVALASYAAAAIAQTRPNEASWKAFMMAMPGFIIPFAIVLHPGLLMTSTKEILDAVWGFFEVFTTFIAVAAAITGYLFRSLGKGWRTYFVMVGVANVLPGAVVSAVTLAALAVPSYVLWRGARRTAVPAASISA